MSLSDIILSYEKQYERTNKMNNAQDRIVAQVAGKPIMESEIDKWVRERRATTTRRAEL